MTLYRHAGGKPSLLIADDDPTIRLMLAELLGEEFECVPAATDAEGALRLALDHQPDVALIDVVMPGGGLTAVREITAHAPEVALVVLSGDESPKLVAEILSSGAMSYVRKGATGPEISQRLSAAMAAKAASS